MDKVSTGGWGWPLNSRKAHYFDAGDLISACGRWMYAGRLPDQGGGSRSPDDCAACWKALDRWAKREPGKAP